MRAVVAGIVMLLAAQVSQVPSAVAAGTEEPVVRIERLGDRALTVGSGSVYGNRMLVLVSRQGLVAVDTGIAPSLTRLFRAEVERELGRRDWAFVVNTHFHFDHTDGNQVFPEATIVGTEDTRRRMLEWNADRAGFVERRRQRGEAWRQQLGGLDPGSEAAARLRDLIDSNAWMCDDLGPAFVLSPPTVTFRDELHLHLGDLSVDLYAWGPGTHTGDDLIVHVPELELVATGDLLFPEGIRLLYGLGEGVHAADKLAVLDRILEHPVSQVVTVHAGVMAGPHLELRRNYWRAMDDAVTAELAAGGTLDGALARLPAARAVEMLDGLELDAGQIERQHREGMRLAWLVRRGARDASEAVAAAVDSGGRDAARAVFREALAARDELWWVDENALNQLGYRLLGEGRAEDAVAVFEMNVEAFPEAWNVHDSLGEGLAAVGDRERAIASYRRSLALNPDNDNAASWIARLEAEQ